LVCRVFTPHGIYSSRYLLLTVFTPHGIYSSRYLLLTVFTPHGIYSSRICCLLPCIWMVAIRCFVARFIQLRSNYIVFSPILYYCRLRSLSISVFFTLSCSLIFVILDVSWVCLFYVLLQWLDFLGSLSFLYTFSLT